MNGSTSPLTRFFVPIPASHTIDLQQMGRKRSHEPVRNYHCPSDQLRAHWMSEFVFSRTCMLLPHFRLASLFIVYELDPTTSNSCLVRPPLRFLCGTPCFEIDALISRVPIRCPHRGVTSAVNCYMQSLILMSSAKHVPAPLLYFLAAAIIVSLHSLGPSNHHQTRLSSSCRNSLRCSTNDSEMTLRRRCHLAFLQCNAG